MDRQILHNAFLELRFWQKSPTGCFNNLLFDLIAKADQENIGKLSQAYPEFVFAFQFFMEFGTAKVDEQIKLYDEHARQKRL